MKITILTLFKDVYPSFLNSSIIKRAIQAKLVEVEVVDFRDYSIDKHKKVDDYQFGGGPGMVLSIQPIADALKHYQEELSHIVLTTPSGKLLNQDKVIELSKKKHLIIIAGHYEGFDERIKNYVDDQVSIGDYVLTGGEIPSMVMLDAIIRLIPGVINEDSLVSESFNNYLLDYPVYTKPVEYDGYKVPDVLLSGNHNKIKKYRHEQQELLTKINRPDLFQQYLKINKERK